MEFESKFAIGVFGVTTLIVSNVIAGNPQEKLILEVYYEGGTVLAIPQNMTIYDAKTAIHQLLSGNLATTSLDSNPKHYDFVPRNDFTRLVMSTNLIPGTYEKIQFREGSDINFDNVGGYPVVVDIAEYSGPENKYVPPK